MLYLLFNYIMIIIVWLFNYLFNYYLVSVCYHSLIANWQPTSSGCSHDPHVIEYSILHRPWYEPPTCFYTAQRTLGPTVECSAVSAAMSLAARWMQSHCCRPLTACSHARQSAPIDTAGSSAKTSSDFLTKPTPANHHQWYTLDPVQRLLATTLESNVNKCT